MLLIQECRLSRIEKSNKELLEANAEKGFPFKVTYGTGKAEETIRNGTELIRCFRCHRTDQLKLVVERKAADAA